MTEIRITDSELWAAVIGELKKRERPEGVKTAQEVAEELNLSRETIRPRLEKLVSAKRMERVKFEEAGYARVGYRPIP